MNVQGLVGLRFTLNHWHWSCFNNFQPFWCIFVL